MALRCALAATAVLGVAASTARADDSPVTDRHYAIELYDNVALGNSATIAMGGASVANAIGSSGTLTNASASAIRQTTDLDSWSWDYHFDFLDSSLSTDADNNGVAAGNGGGTAALTAGLALRFGDWAGAITATRQRTHIDGADAMGADLYADTLRSQLALAHWIRDWDLAIGGAVEVADFSLTQTTRGSTALFTITAPGFDAGATWIPELRSYRLGAQIASGISGGNVEADGCDPNNCMGYILPDHVVAPWRAAVGGAYRFAPTSWNQQVAGDYRDERALTVVADLVVAGSDADAFGLEAFGQHQLQRTGVHPSYSARGGAEFEWLPGRLRVRAGSYFEPGRFAGVDGRIHATFGTEVRVFDFHAWGRRRGRITLTGDLASSYRNLSLSVGFWH